MVNLSGLVQIQNLHLWLDITGTSLSCIELFSAFNWGGCSCEFNFLALLISFVALYAGSMEMGACFSFFLQLGILYISLQALIERLLYVFQSNILSSITNSHLSAFVVD